MIDRVVTNADVSAQNDPAADEAPKARVIPGNVQATDVTAEGERPDPIEAKRKEFDAEQEAARANFERSNNATLSKMERDQNFAEAKAEREAKVAEMRQANQDMALEHGVITHDDLIRQRSLLAPHSQNGVLRSHEVLGAGEETVKMAFPHTVILTLSAADVKRWNDSAPTTEEVTPVTHGARVVFYQGYDDVPVGLADHRYLYDAGAYRVDSDGKPESVEDRDARLRAAKDADRAGHEQAGA